MTHAKVVTAQSGHMPSSQTGNFIPALLISLFLLMVYVALLGADSSQLAQSAPEAAGTGAGGPSVGYAMDAAPAKRLVEEDLIQPYIEWLQAAHANAAINGKDEPLPMQF